ncbi:T9SS type A sorting domain-containing protein [Flavobacterium sp. NRK1]|uniref:T9SS type A sorting domain-containing protein n=1 Tax=Flavobacterium sp. NRK1 TaxID=2954929 RepID=UPI002092CD4F|nr:T9SS type A sorting domain-containing protein [Flavobacterium sp. NRK1]MCO6148495.1 T9SS type A sorting domain-containing protein [Flavobacterium sp. NRK1]
MKKTTLLLLLLVATSGMQAQNFYNFTTFQEDYSDLENSTSINNNAVWDYDEFQVINLPFNLSIGGQTVNKFLFADDYFAFITPNGDYDTDTGVFYIYPSAALIQDRTYSSNVSSSPISYKIEGETGSRILKLEIKNAGLENATELDFAEDHFYLNNQIWIYEADNAIEFRYGDHNITDIAYIAEPDERILAGMEYSNEKIYVMYGQSTQPTYGEFTLQNLPDSFSADAYPANGTVYRLEISQVAGLHDFSSSTVSLYPNPASSVINIQSENFTASEYSIYNILGKLVADGKTDTANDTQINIENLDKGIYFLKINNNYLKFIKK